MAAEDDGSLPTVTLGTQVAQMATALNAVNSQLAVQTVRLQSAQTGKYFWGAAGLALGIGAGVMLAGRKRHTR